MNKTQTSFDREAAKRRLGQELARYRLGRVRRIAVRNAAMVWLLLAFFIWGLLIFVLGIAVINGNSMYPTIHSGDFVVYLRLNRAVQTGDIVVYEDNGPVVKRVIAVPGELVEIDNSSGDVSIDGHPLHEPYIASGGYMHGDVNFPLTVPPGTYFVLGDNRSNSIDSRSSTVGMISEKDILGKVVYLYRINI